jgi:hypothetical protein
MNSRNAMKALLPIAATIVLHTTQMQGQSFEISGLGGFGVADGDGYGKSRVTSGGVTFGWPYASGHKLQFDYTFAHLERRFINYNRHFFTGSYVIQPRQGRTRPFFSSGRVCNTRRTTQTKW